MPQLEHLVPVLLQLILSLSLSLKHLMTLVLDFGVLLLQVEPIRDRHALSEGVSYASSYNSPRPLECLGLCFLERGLLSLDLSLLLLGPRV